MGLPKPILTEDEYLTLERASLERHQYVDGEIFAMAGESGSHADIVMNTSQSLANQLDGSPCRVRTQNTKVRSGPLPKSPRRQAGLYSYPDIVVICEEPKYLDGFKDVILNPKIIIETLSESTEAFDRGEKFARYQRYNPTLTDYVLISQDQPKIEHFQRGKNGKWEYECYFGLKAIVKLDTIQCKLKATDVYKRIAFENLDDE